MHSVIRISAERTREKILSGEATLVCAYEEADKFKSNNLEGAIAWQTFQSRLPEISKDQEIVFYCAWTAETTAVGRAETYLGQGYRNVKVLEGGVAAWKEAHYPLNCDLWHLTSQESVDTFDPSI